MNHDFTRILALSPHTGDVELGAGGAVARWIEEGKEIFYVAFSIAEKSVPESFPKDILEHEVKQATKVLGIAGDNLIIHKFEVRRFPELRQNILEIMVSLRNKLRPDLVLLPSLRDMHQDHRTIAEEGTRAFKYASILSYELAPWNITSFEPSLFVILQERHLGKKAEAISCYQSQTHRQYFNGELLHMLARIRGVQINAKYAEAFEVVRWFIL